MTTLTREQWQEPGWEIGAHTDSPPVNPAALEFTVNHYPAVKTISPADPVAWFRGLQRNYVNGRGYSVGYSWGYWPDGTEVELRGWDYRSAANDVPGRPGNENAVSISLLLVVAGLGDLAHPATSGQVAAIRSRLIEVHQRIGHAVPNIVHGDLEPTQCAGAGVNHQTRCGLFLPVAPTPIPEVEGDMILIRVDKGTDYAIFAETPAGVLRWIPDDREYHAWTDTGAPEAKIPPAAFGTIVDYARTAGGISGDVTRITGITTERWAARGIG